MTKFGLGMHHHEVSWIKVGFYRQGHSEGSYNKNMTVSTISSELLIIFGSKLSLVVHHHKPKALQKDWIVVIPDLASVKSLLINSLYKNKWLSITVDSEKASLWISRHHCWFWGVLVDLRHCWFWEGILVDLHHCWFWEGILVDLH